MIRVSAGTAKVLGLKDLRSLVDPTTGYLMTSGRCRNSCAFCPQEEGLSRITWPEYAKEEVAAALGSCQGLKRLCLQVTDQEDWLTEVKAMVKDVQKVKDLPICISCYPRTLQEAEDLLSLGIDQLSIPLDAATPEIGERVGRLFWPRMKMLEQLAVRFPGRLNTHLIIGLGESEKEAVQLLQWLADRKINTALFAFTPVKGTPLAAQAPPHIGRYRRMQAARYLITLGLRDFCFQAKRLILTDEQKHQLAPQAFETSGCPDCNRPFYNERPGGIMYNYPRTLSADEYRRALEEMERYETELATD